MSEQESPIGTQLVYYFIHPPNFTPNCNVIFISEGSGPSVRVVVNDALNEQEYLDAYLIRKEVKTLQCKGCGKDLIVP